MTTKTKKTKASASNEVKLTSSIHPKTSSREMKRLGIKQVIKDGVTSYQRTA